MARRLDQEVDTDVDIDWGHTARHPVASEAVHRWTSASRGHGRSSIKTSPYFWKVLKVSEVIFPPHRLTYENVASQGLKVTKYAVGRVVASGGARQGIFTNLQS